MPLDAARRSHGAAALRDFFSGAHPAGLYAQRDVDCAAQDTLLAAVDMRMAPDAVSACLDDLPAPDPTGPLPPPAPCAGLAGELLLEELEAALKRMPRGKSPGDDGLPYEFYTAFWPELCRRLLAVPNGAFHADSAAPLPLSMRSGRITLLYKGKGADRALPSSYRPITLLNCDYKLAAAAVAARLGAPLSTVIDTSQTAFLPKRWIGDNVLGHLEEIAYLQATRQPGVQVFLDLAKAFDRIDRAWVLRSLAALGVPEGALRWVQVLHGGTCASVAYNGWVTEPFPVCSGVFQGSPLSPILYVAASQPLAALTRRLAAQGAVRPILLPSGQAAPVLHQHADDTTIHVRTRADARIIMEGPVQLFCRASGSSVQPSKSQGLEICAPDGGDPFSGACPLTGVQFVAGDEAIRHLGVLLGHNPIACAEEAYTALSARLESRARRFARIDLGFYGRTYIAKQVLASMASHLACFVRAPPPMALHLTRLLCTYVAANRVCAGPSVHGTSSRASAAALHPGRNVCSMPWAWGGVNHVDFEIQTQALQARNIARLLEPEWHAWKAYIVQWLGRDPAWLAAHPHVLPRAVDRWGLGLAAVFFDVPLDASEVDPRVLAYVLSFRALGAHRAYSIEDTPFEAMLQEPLFFNPRIRCTESGRPLVGAGWRAVAEAGIRRVGNLRQLLSGPLPATVTAAQRRALFAALPQVWADALHGGDRRNAEWLLPAAAAPEGVALWRRITTSPPPQAAGAGPAAGAAAVAARWQPYALAHSSGRLAAAAAPPLAAPPPQARAALVMEWDPARPWHVRKGRFAALVPAGAQPYLVGAWSEAAVDPRGWLIGRAPCVQLAVKAANLRLQARRAVLGGHANPLGSPLRPAVWGAGLHAMEARWREALAGRGLLPRLGRAPGPGAAPPGQHNPAFEAPWMRPAPPRAPPGERRGRTLAAAAPPRAPPGERRGRTLAAAAPNDMVDALAVHGPPPPWSPVWRAIHEHDLDRRQACVAWRILHGQLRVGMFTGYIRHHSSPDECRCPHAACSGAGQSLTHVFLDCVIARPVLEWLAQVWSAVTGEPAPALTAAILLAGDTRGWDLPQALEPLWLRLRLAALWHLWLASRRGLPAAGQQPHTATRVASAILHSCRGTLLRDWARVTSPAAADFGVPAAWLRGRPLALSLAQFQGRWCHRGVLCRAAAGPDGPDLRLHWTASHPVPLPPAGIG